MEMQPQDKWGQKSVKLKQNANELIEKSKCIGQMIEQLGDNIEEIIKY